MQPDTAAIASLAFVPLVWIVEREGTAAVEVSQFFARQVGGDVINPDRGLFVTLDQFFGAKLALGDVVIGNKTWSTAIGEVIFVKRTAVSAWCRQRWQNVDHGAFAADSAAQTALLASRGNP